MNEELKIKFSNLMYSMTKMAAKHSFIEFIEDVDINEDEWEEIKSELKEKYNLKFYV